MDQRTTVGAATGAAARGSEGRNRTRLQILTTITVLTALFSVGWFGALAIVTAAVDLPSPIFWFVGLLLGALCFGTFVTALREGGARQLIVTLRRTRT